MKAFKTVIRSSVLLVLALGIFNGCNQQQPGTGQPSASASPKVTIDDNTDDPKIWGQNFPLQYAQYLKTTEQVKTKYGGSEALPHTPTEQDPRTIVSTQKVEADPRFKTIWAGYAFATDFREERGHAYMFDDQKYTQRQVVVKQPGTCINCHASTYTAMKTLGNGDIMKGFDEINKKPYSEAKELVKHPVSCIDCHDPATMKLRITRPGFINGIKAYKESQGIKDFDLSKASDKEMKSFVCGQCHVEYYFKGDAKTLTFPWFRGVEGDKILEYYDTDTNGFKDWQHKETGAPTLKAQHPEFEMWNKGYHKTASCADCHMPQIELQGQKISDHHVRSPLLNMEGCKKCHTDDMNARKTRVEAIQDKYTAKKEETIKVLMDLIAELGKQPEVADWKKITDATEKSKFVFSDKVKKAQDFQRKGQFLFDFAEAENSTGFHAPDEALRLLTKSMDYSRQGMDALK